MTRLTKEQRDERVYNWIAVCDDNLDPTEVKIKVMKKDFRLFWVDWLTKEELEKYGKLGDLKQLHLHISADPITALKNL